MLGRLMLSNAFTVNFGLLIIRLGAGGSMAALHGYGKLTAGTDKWRGLGSTLEPLGVPDTLFLPLGFMAMFAEFFGSILVALGFLGRVGAFLLMCTMIVANYRHGFGDDFNELALVYLVVFAGLLITGPGAFSLDRVLFGRRKPTAE